MTALNSFTVKQKCEASGLKAKPCFPPLLLFLMYAAEPEPALIVASAQSVSDKSANPTRDSSLEPETACRIS